MKITEIFKLSFEAIRERKARARSYYNNGFGRVQFNDCAQWNKCRSEGIY